MKKPSLSTELPTLPGVSARALFRHRRRAGGNLTKYNVARWPGTTRKNSISSVQAQKENPDFVYAPLLSRVFPPALCFPHCGRAGGNLTKYDVARWLDMIRVQHVTDSLYKKKDPATAESFFLWNPATSYSPGCFHPRSASRTAGARAET